MLYKHSLIPNDEQIIIIPSIASEIGIGATSLLGFIYNSCLHNTYFYSSMGIAKSYPLQSKTATVQHVRILLNKEYIIKYNLSPEEKRDIVVDKTPSISKIGEKKCAWCGSVTLILNDHHFPVSRKDGGTDIVKICPNCHYEYHSLKYILKPSTDCLLLFQETENKIKNRFYEECYNA